MMSVIEWYDMNKGMPNKGTVCLAVEMPDGYKTLTMATLHDGVIDPDWDGAMMGEPYAWSRIDLPEKEETA